MFWELNLQIHLTKTFTFFFLIRGAEYVSAREWMRICFELLELLKAHKKAIRRATVNTFGYIAKAIGWVLFTCVCIYKT